MEYSTQPSFPSYVPYYMSGLTEKMNFVQRVQNFVLKMFINFGTLIQFYVSDQVISEYLPGSPSSAEMVANISGCLVNSHSIYEVPMPRVPTYVNVLGTTIDKEVKP